MVPTREGYWLIQLKLPPGPFCFRYRADRRWHIDPDEVGDRDRRTGWFSIIDVPDPSGPIPVPGGASAASARPAWRDSRTKGRTHG